MKTQLEHWRTLDAVITYGGVSQAAQKLHRTQSAVSYSLKQLEEQAGIALVTLVGRKLQLTPAGQQLLQEARQVLQRMRLLDEQANLLARGIESSITIAVEQIAPMTPMLAAVKNIQQHYPHINLHWHEMILSEMNLAFTQYNADLMIAAHMPLNHTGHGWQEVRFAVVVAPDHPLTQYTNLSLTDLTEYTQVVIRDSGQGNIDIGWLASPKRYTVDHLHTAYQLVQQGLAYAWLPEHLIEKDVTNGALVLLKLAEGDMQQVRLQLILNPNKSHGAVILALRDQLLAQKQ